MPSVSANGVDFHVREAGTGPPVLLVHGGAGDADSWGGIYDELTADHHVVAYDRRGCSRTRADALADWHVHGGDAATVLGALEAAPATVVGWSAGGLIALDLAIHHPDLVTSLILREPVFAARRTVTPAAAWAFAKARVARATRGPEKATESYVRWLSRRRTDGNTWDDPAFPEDRRRAIRANGVTLWTEVGARDTAIVARAGEIECPVVVILGGESASWFGRMARRLRTAIPHATAETIPWASHSFSFRSPEHVAKAIHRHAEAQAEREEPAA